MPSLLQYLGYLVAGVAIGGAFATGACSDASSGAGSNGGAGGFAAADGSAADAGSGGSAAQDASSGGSGGTLNVDATTSDVISVDAACDLQKYEATLKKKPVDIVFIIDTSCSMDAENTSVQNNINVNFAQIMQVSGIDYRVVLIGGHDDFSADYPICIDPPLSGATCPATLPAGTPPVNNPPIFYHYDAGVGSKGVYSSDGWCKSLVWATEPDRFQLIPNGWLELLRPEAFKSFVMISDDDVQCTNTPTSPGSTSWSCSTSTCSYDDTSNPSQAATQFDADLLALSPTQFGTAAERNYIWHSIVGVPSKGSAYAPTEPLVASSTKCPSAVNSSPGNQALSILTGGLRFPVCEGTGFDVVFQEIAKGVIEGAKIECEFPMPEPPPEKELDPATIEIEFTPSAGGNPQKFVQVDSAAQCKAGAFYIEGETLKLCPQTCELVQADSKAKIQILALCKPDIAR